MSVKEARKLLGKEAVNMTDKQVAKLIDETHEFAKLPLQVAKENRLKDEQKLS